MRFISIVCMALLLAGVIAHAAKMVNNRYVPTKTDWSSVGAGGPNPSQMESLFVDLATILPIGTRPVDGLDVDSIRTEYIRGNPDVDSVQIGVLSGMSSISGNPTIDSATIAIILGSNKIVGNPTVDSISGGTYWSVQNISGLSSLAGNPTIDSISGGTYWTIANLKGLTSIAGNPTIDSISGGTYWQVGDVSGLNALHGNPLVDSVVFGSGNPSITNIDTGATDDTLYITIGGRVRKVLAAD